MYIKDSIEYVERKDLNFSNDSIESVFVEIDKSVYSRDKNIIVASIYRTPNSDIDIFNNELELILSKIQRL